MPELPEVETTKQGLLPLLNQTVIAVDIRQPSLRQPVPTQLHDICDATCLELSRRGKYIILKTSKGFAIIHLGMSGSLRLTQQAEPYRKHDHVILTFNNGQSLRFHDPRRFGVFLWLTSDPFAHPLIASLGVEPLEDSFTADYLFKKSRTKKIAIKKFIMDSHIVVGVGNIYANEALFAAKIHPLTPSNQLNIADYQRLHHHIYHILQAAIIRGGTTLRDFVNSQGEMGYFQQELMVYGKEGKPCIICQSPLQLVRINNRSTIYCSQCQPAFCS
ncbi:MAG: bifunctional DNA-formamidopyrimidine glycosylase/DNA-(apurinic or apyrimidinic site) lyase [Moraxellaceae bacterium]|nr:bifunctional DNA-formamidopyrimidine glycosylase/DNA-(apurinic or apyrimidinic site) lyase [Moraxellaceae bacterium]